MKIDPVRPLGSGPRTPDRGVSKEAQIAYEARASQVREGASLHGFERGLRVRTIDSDYGPTVLLSEPGERAGGSMLLLSAALLRKLLTAARLTRPPRRKGRPPRRRLDISV
jgi:hypothetical protein